MRGFWKTWLVFGLSLTLVLAALGWTTLIALRLESAEGEARRLAQREENVRLALWRMESALAPLTAQEGTRPYFTYSAYYPAGRAYTCMFLEPEEGEALVPSPLLLRRPEHVILHFQFGPDGEVSSPQVPAASPERFLPRACLPRPEAIETAAARLTELQALVTREALGRVLLGDDRCDDASLGGGSPPAWEKVPQGSARQAVLNRNDLRARFLWCEPTAVQRQVAGGPFQSEGPLEVREGLLQPLWTGNALLLARRVTVNAQDYIQGCWLDWPHLRQRLLASIADLLPQADILPVANMQPGVDEESHNERRLAALPLQLVPGEVTTAPGQSLSSVRLSLGLAWGCVLLAAAAVAALLWGAVSLSERRGAFVSAVTHELRTPLTTFRLYAEMLAGGMVQGEEKKKSYLAKLQSEADRLSHLVENVLGFARLEGGRSGHVEVLPLCRLVERAQDGLAERARQAGMSLQVETEAPGESVRADAAAVEQILVNLVDNACKYAAGAADRRIHVEAGPGEGPLAIRVRDHGPGIALEEARRLFRPFSKSDRDAANSAPGVGLGLALSRRLARDMGGDLRLVSTAATAAAGACFELSLPAG